MKELAHVTTVTLPGSTLLPVTDATATLMELGEGPSVFDHAEFAAGAQMNASVPPCFSQ